MVQGYAQADTSYTSGWCSCSRYFKGDAREPDQSTGIAGLVSYSDNCCDLQWCLHQTEELKLRESGKVRREAGGAMLTISGLKNFYYIPGVTDMRCGYNRLLQIVKQMTHHDPYNGDVFVFMSRDRRKVKMVHFENHAYYIHEKAYTNGYSFMLMEFSDENGMKSYRMNWKDVVAVLESPVVKKLRLK